MNKVKYFLIFFTMSVLFNTCFAFNFGLTSNEFEAKKGSHQSLLLSNPGDKHIAIELSMETRKHLPDGTEINEDIDDEFIIYPSMILLAPGQDQVVSIKWNGPENIEKEMAYRLAIAEVPINQTQVKNEQLSSTTRASIMVLRKFLKSIYVLPLSKKLDIKLVGFKTITSNKGIKQLELTFNNNGTIHYLLENAQIKITDEHNNTTGIYTPENFKKVNLLAGDIRKTTIDIPENIVSDQIKIEFIQK